MRIISIVTMSLIVTACEPAPGPPRMDENSIRERAQLVRQCSQGLHILRDPISKRLVWSTYWETGGVIEKGLTPDQVCGTEKIIRSKG